MLLNHINWYLGGNYNKKMELGVRLIWEASHKDYISIMLIFLFVFCNFSIIITQHVLLLDILCRLKTYLKEIKYVICKYEQMGGAQLYKLN